MTHTTQDVGLGPDVDTEIVQGPKGGEILLFNPGRTRIVHAEECSRVVIVNGNPDLVTVVHEPVNGVEYRQVEGRGDQ